MSGSRQLLREIEAFLLAHDMRASYFGRDALNDTALVSRLRGGGTVRLETADKLRDFMQAYAAKHPPRSSADHDAAQDAASGSDKSRKASKKSAAAA